MAIEDLISVLMDISKIFTSLTHIQKIKLNASLENDVDKLEGCLKKEQAASMELRSLEKRRIQVIESLGYESLSFDEMVDRTDERYAADLYNAVRILKEAAKNFSALSDEVRTVIELNLANLNMLLSQRLSQTANSTDLPNIERKKPIGSTSITDFKA